MSEVKHTPGPWFTSPSMPTRVLKQFRGGKITNEIVCRTDYAWATEEERRANASLIAAAPDLLEALQRLIESSRDGGEMQWYSETALASPWDRARAAIARATGASHE